MQLREKVELHGWIKVLEEMRMKFKAKVKVPGLILIWKKDDLSSQTGGKR